MAGETGWVHTQRRARAGAARSVYRGLGDLGSTVKAGAVLKYGANITATGGFAFDLLSPIGIGPSPLPSSGLVQGAVQAGIMGNGALSQFSMLPQNDYEANVIAVITSSIDRGSEQDLKGDIDAALSTIVGIRSSVMQFVSNPGGGVTTVNVGSMLPGGDKYHAGDTILGTAWDAYFGGLKLPDALKNGGPLLWVGLGALALILFSRR